MKPFPGLIPWSEFSFSFPAEEAPRILDTLRGVTEKELAQMQVRASWLMDGWAMWFYRRESVALVLVEYTFEGVCAWHRCGDAGRPSFGKAFVCVHRRGRTCWWFSSLQMTFQLLLRRVHGERDGVFVRVVLVFVVSSYVCGFRTPEFLSFIFLSRVATLSNSCPRLS